MTVITDRVLRHVCRKARWNIGGRKRATWRFDAGRGGGGNEGKGNEGIDSGRRNEISRSRGRNKSRIVSSMGYDRRRKRNTGTKRKSRYLGIDTTDVGSERPMPFNRLISLRRQNSHCCLSHNWLLPRVTVHEKTRKTDQASLLSILAAPFFFTFPSSFLRKLFLRGFIPPRRALSRLLPYSLCSGLFLLIFDRTMLILPCIF